MSKIDNLNPDWEHLYSQYKNAEGDPVICMVHKRTKKFVYYDVKLNRVLSKQEALLFRVDVTGKHHSIEEVRAPR